MIFRSIIVQFEGEETPRTVIPNSFVRDDTDIGNFEVSHTTYKPILKGWVLEPVISANCEYIRTESGVIRMNQDVNDTMGIEPMLAGKFEASKQVFPCYVQPKLDGIRCLVINGKPYSRTLKLIKNDYVRNWFIEHSNYLNGLDGELIVGEPTATNVYRDTMSGIMSQGGIPDFKFYCFDMLETSCTFEDRFKALQLRAMRISDRGDKNILKHFAIVLTLPTFTHEALLKHESVFLAAGYEGAIVRSAYGKYKMGKRPSAHTGELLKLKRFLDEEAIIIGFDELLSNQNESITDALGHAKRSSHQENKVPQNKLGALVVRNARGQQFNVGSGFDMATRQRIWDNKEEYLGKTITYRYVIVGGYDLPRFPIFKAIRPEGT